MEFRVEVPDVEELAEGDPRDVVRRERAAQGALGGSGDLVLGADTAVVLDGRAVGQACAIAPRR